jgi:Arc/MetJ-type ribon-helix-helix transcriptional regulator
MGAVQLTDELQHYIEQKVAEGRASSSSALVEEAVTRLLNDALEEECEIRHVVQAGIEAGRRVCEPRHLVIYRTAPDGEVEILGLVRDRLVLSRAARNLLRDAGARAARPLSSG